MKVESVYSTTTVEADADEPLTAAASRMREHDVSSLAVTQRGNLVGMVSERDIVQAVADGASPGRTPVSRYMAENPATATLDEDSADVAKRMIELGVRHLPVVDRGRGLIGVVSARDLLYLEAWAH